MARLPLITSKEQVPAEHHAIADAVIKSVPFSPGPDGAFALPAILPDEPSAAGR